MRKSRLNNVNNASDEAGNKRKISRRLRQHHYAIKNVGKALLQSRWTVAVNTVILGLSLSLPLALVSVTNHFEYFTRTFNPPHAVYIELKNARSKNDQEYLIASLKRDLRVAELTFLSRDDVLERVVEQLSLEHSAEIMAINPFSDMLEVNLAREDYTEESLLKFVKQLGENPLVSRADASQSLIAREQTDLKDLFERFALILSGVVLISVLLVCGYMVRNQILRQHLEIEVTRYCGAENAFIRRPFLYWGAAQGLLGGICAGAIVFLCAAFLGSPGAGFGELNSLGETLNLIYLPEFMLILVIGVLLGFIGAWLATRVQFYPKLGTEGLH